MPWARSLSTDAEAIEIEQPWPSQLMAESVTAAPSLCTAARSVISSPQVGLSWCDSPDLSPCGGSASGDPFRFLACSRMICWYSCCSSALTYIGAAEERADPGDGVQERVDIIVVLYR